MNIAEYTIRRRVISWTGILLLLIGGIVSFSQLGRLEWPEFPMPVALVLTAYPGASPEQVEEEVTLPLERAIQELEYLRHISSVSSAGLSQIEIELSHDYSAEDQPQIWDELRRKVGDIQALLPPGVQTSLVNDDFSDVYGILFNISGPDYDYRELENYADILHRELLRVDGVKSVSIAGKVSKQVIIEISQQKLATLDIDPGWIYGLIQQQNIVSNAGKAMVNGQSIRIHPTGEFNDVSELKQLLISPPGRAELVYLGDIADIYTDFEETPLNLYRNNGEQALSLGISFVSGANVVKVGQRVEQRLTELEHFRPIGMKLTKVADQPRTVTTAINDFTKSAVVSVTIVILVLLITMGLRAGLLMGVILLLTILGTFIGMQIMDVELELVSLGALIIALGMLVDNAIVITEGVLVGLKRGKTRMEAIQLVVKHHIWPLFGATVIAILAFAPIGLSPDATGDFMNSLFKVLLISLSISWVLSVTLTPFFCHMVFSDPDGALEEHQEDPYKGMLFSAYRVLLNTALRHRISSMVLVLAALISALFAFGHVKEQFFPPANTPLFFVDVWGREGTDIRQTETSMALLEQEVLGFDEVINLTTVMGMGAQRFVLTYNPEKNYSSFGQFLIEVDSLATIRALLPRLQNRLEERYPEFDYKFRLSQNGPSPAANIEARFYGPDPDVLRALASEAISRIDKVPEAVDTRHSWREPVTVLRPQLDEAAARRSGISKQALDDALLVNFTGKPVGLYRDGSHMLPIIARAPEHERLNVDRMQDLQVWSQEHSAYVPIKQVVTGFTMESENSLILRRNLRRVLTVLTDVHPLGDDTPESLRQRLKDDVASIPLPPGYELEWGGEYEEAVEANESVYRTLPMGYLIMFLITILLFNTIRQPLAIWSTVPLSIIGIAFGLLVMNIPFSFTALLGMLSLSGMLVKNGIVLVEQINIENEKDISEQQAITDACVSRVRPVCMAAITTILGMMPLLVDAFYQSMAVTIVFGLGSGTVLTLIVLPVIYSLLYRIRFDQK